MNRYLLLFITILGSSILGGFNLVQIPDKSTSSTRIDLAGNGSINENIPDISWFEIQLKNDTTLFAAFRNLRFAAYAFSNELVFSAKKGSMPGVYKSINSQSYIDSCRGMKVEHELINRNFYKEGNKHIYQTAKMYDSLFYTNQAVCGEQRNKPMIPDYPGKSRKDHYTDQLKVLVFRPGIETDLPFIGSKTAVFSQDLRQSYDFLREEIIFQGIPAFRFIARPKKQLSIKSKKKLAIQHLVTVLDKKNQQVLFRDYHIKMNNWIFDCDIKMQVEIQKINKTYYPKYIKYEGYWDIIGIEEERGMFEISFYDFNLI